MHGMVAGDGFEKHVVLERRNYLRLRVSGRVAEESGRYHRIENYEEVAQVLSGTRHAWMLDG